MVAFSVLGVIFGECECQGTFDCQSSIDANGGILLWTIITLYMFKALGTVCDEYFVPSLEMISEKLELSNDVAGATFMAAGSSAPELFTSIVATFLIVNEGGVGAIIGSAIFNILVIVGATCAFAGQVLSIWWYPLARDCSFYMLSIAELALFIMDEKVEWWEGLIMFLTYCLYCWYMKYNEKVASMTKGAAKVEVVNQNEAGDTKQGEVSAKENHKLKEIPFGSVDSSVSTCIGSIPSNDSVPSEWYAFELGVAVKATPDAFIGIVPSDSSQVNGEPPVIGDLGGTGEVLTGVRINKAVTPESLASMGSEGSQSITDLKSPKPLDESGSEEAESKKEEEEDEKGKVLCVDPLNFIWEKVMPDPEKYWRLFFMSILNIALCTYVMVDAVNRSGCDLNVSPLVMGLVFLAAGTSVPDALGSIAVARQGEGDMAVANALGSNIFDILLGLGVPWLITGLLGREVTFQNVSADLLYWICVLVGVLVLFLATLILNGWKLTKTVGVVLMTLYVIHVSAALIRVFV